jgi:hypothetical protein
MKRATVKKIDGYTVVTSIETGVVDPMSTRLAADAALTNHPGYQEVLKEIEDLRVEFLNREKDLLKRRVPKKEIDYTLDTLVKNRRPKLKKIQRDLKELWEQVLSESTTYFEPRRDEIHIDDEIAEQLVNIECRPGEHVCIDGSTVMDYRGQTFHHFSNERWEVQEITRLGETPSEGGRQFTELGESERAAIKAQREFDRIAGLTPEQKQTEYEARYENVLNDAAVYMNRLALLGDNDAENKARAQLEEKDMELKLKYDIGG